MVALALCLAASGFAQPELTGAGHYPQFRNLSGLPGAGFGITPDGRLGFHGALAYSTPVAYSMRNWDMVFSATNVSNTMRPSFLEDDNAVLFDGNEGNGTWQLLVGVPLGEYGNVTFSHLILSSLLDDAQNLHWAPPRQRGPVLFAIGVQDISGQGNAAGENLPGDLGNSRSYYVVGTWDAGLGTLVSLGTGDTRSKPIFVSASFRVSERVPLELRLRVRRGQTARKFSVRPLDEHDVHAGRREGQVRVLEPVGRVLVDEADEVPAVLVLHHRLGQLSDLVGVDPSLEVGDLLRA